MNKLFPGTSWQWIHTESDVDVIVDKFTQLILEKARLCIPEETRTVSKSTHEWVTPKCGKLIKDKNDACGTPQWGQLRDECNAGLLAEHVSFIGRTKKKLCKLAKMFKKW